MDLRTQNRRRGFLTSIAGEGMDGKPNVRADVDKDLAQDEDDQVLVSVQVVVGPDLS